MSIVDVINQLNELRKLSGNAQLEYLAQVKNPLLREVLEYTYNPHKTYKIDECKLALAPMRGGLLKRKLKPGLSEEEWHKFTEMLDTLSEKRSASLDDVRILKRFITDYSSLDVQALLSQVVAKDLRLNLGLKKLQTVWPDFCKQTQVQLAEEFAGKLFIQGYYSRKFDGKRMVIEQGVAKSRAGKPCKVAPVSHILDELADFPKDVVLDGELLYFEKDGREDFQKAISLSSSDDRTSECDNLYYVVFDMINLDAWNTEKSIVEFSTEYQLMLQQFSAYAKPLTDGKSFGYSVLHTKYPHILIARQDTQPDRMQRHRMEFGWEGLMYRNGKAPYQFKRTKQIQKIKAMKDSEFKLIGMLEGTGKHQGSLGAILIKKDGQPVGVGSGFTDAERHILWTHKDIFLSDNCVQNYKVKVQYFEETMDADGNPSLRFPVYLCFRHNTTKEEINVFDLLEKL